MQTEGVAVGVHYPPNHLQPAFSPWHRDLPATEQVAQEILTLPFHPAMTSADVDHVVNVLGKVLHTTCGRYGRPSATTDSSTSTSRSAASGRP